MIYIMSLHNVNAGTTGAVYIIYFNKKEADRT